MLVPPIAPVRQQLPVPFQEWFWNIWGLRLSILTLMKRLKGLLNQAIIAQEDVDVYYVIRRVWCRQLGAWQD